uniref:NAD-dependent epimerase/dehydratase family protein n=1 Tax=Nocardia farcinica TaxID=37329 RepID=UPI00245581B9
MTSLVTGATGFIGRFLVPALLRRGDTVHVLVPPDERGRYDTCARDWAGGERVRPVEADLDRVDPAWVGAPPRGHEHHINHDPPPRARPPPKAQPPPIDWG